MNKLPAFLILGITFVLGLTFGAGVGYIVIGPGLPTNLPFTGSSGPSMSAIDTQYNKDMSGSDPQKLSEIAFRNLAWSTQRSLNLPLYTEDELNSIQGITFDGNLSLSIPSRDGQNFNLDAQLKTDHYVNGASRNELILNKPELGNLKRVVLKENGKNGLVLFPDSQEYYRTKAGQMSQFNNQINQFTVEPDDVSKSTESLDGESYISLESSKNQQSITVLVAESPPHTIRQLRLNNGRSTRTVTMEYLDNNRKRFQSVRFSSSNRPSRGVELTFSYDGSSINTVNVEQTGGNQLTLEFQHGSQYSNGFDLTGSNLPESGVEARWGYRDRFPSMARLNVTIPVKQQSLEAGIELTNMTWPRESSPLSMSPPSNFSQLDDRQLQQKIMPVATQLMMKGMRMRQQFSR